MDSQVSPKKKSIFTKWWFWVITVVVVFILIGSVNSSSPTKSVPAPADANTATSAIPTTAAPAFQTLLDVSGSGSKTTAKFTAASDWDLNYTYDCSNFGDQGNFQVMIYNGDGSMSFDNVAVNELGASGTDVEHYHKGGTYYLVVNSECKWKVSVKG
jgi:hypothetical protein